MESNSKPQLIIKYKGFSDRIKSNKIIILISLIILMMLLGFPLIMGAELGYDVPLGIFLIVLYLLRGLFNNYKVKCFEDYCIFNGGITMSSYKKVELEACTSYTVVSNEFIVGINPFIIQENRALWGTKRTFSPTPTSLSISNLTKEEIFDLERYFNNSGIRKLNLKEFNNEKRIPSLYPDIPSKTFTKWLIGLILFFLIVFSIIIIYSVNSGALKF